MQVKEAAATVSIPQTRGLTLEDHSRDLSIARGPMDLQFMASCLKAEGTSVFEENIFENRYRHAQELRRMGADINIDGKLAFVKGVGELNGAEVSATDLRGGAALVAAALGARGETVIRDTGHIARGYEAFDRMLTNLGADVRYEI